MFKFEFKKPTSIKKATSFAKMTGFAWPLHKTGSVYVSSQVLGSYVFYHIYTHCPHSPCSVKHDSLSNSATCESLLLYLLYQLASMTFAR